MKLLARHLLLAALLLKALVPLGWMPGSAALGEAAWIICSADGTISHGDPGKNDARQHAPPCAFAGAHVMAAPQVHAIAAPLLAVAASAAALAPAAILAAGRFAPQAARAPPLSA